MHKRQWTRRNLLKTGLALAVALLTRPGAAVEERGLRLDKVFESYSDEVTGARVFDLTPGDFNSNTTYQTHPMWTPGAKYLLFQSDKFGASQACLLEMSTGEIRPVLDAACRYKTMLWKSSTLYGVLNEELIEVDVIDAFRKKAAPRVVAKMPDAIQGLSGTMTAEKKTVYCGVTLEKEKRWAMMACDIASGVWRTVIELDFQIGHLQVNPFREGQIMFCHETGGDAPQRTWLVKADGSGLRPTYKETYGEWVTHELFWGPDKIIFTIWPYDEAHSKQPHGVAVAKLAGGEAGEMEILSQYRAWHTHASPDGRWAMGDDFDRNIWLIDAQKKKRRLLTQGHLGQDAKTHPHGSFTPDSRAIVFNSSRKGKDHLFLVELPAWESLPES